MAADDLAARLEALELRVAHQDATIDDLNSVITAQWGRIDALLRQQAGLADRLAEAEARSGGSEPQQPPPHY